MRETMGDETRFPVVWHPALVDAANHRPSHRPWSSEPTLPRLCCYFARAWEQHVRCRHFQQPADRPKGRCSLPSLLCPSRSSLRGKKASRGPVAGSLS